MATLSLGMYLLSYATGVVKLYIILHLVYACGIHCRCKHDYAIQEYTFSLWVFIFLNISMQNEHLENGK